MERGVYEVFSIEGGRKHFYQWDLSQKIVVKDPTINEVHFCNGTRDCSLVTVVKDGKADVPNVLLQTAGKVKVYGYSVNHTVVEYVYKVVERTKPEDYVYEETEVLRYAELEKRITELEENGGGASGGYTLETMSPDTKGGAKVGKGLKMDGEALTVEVAKKENAGKILYVNAEGFISPLRLGEGLKIIGDVLTIATATNMVRAVCGMALAGQIKVGEVK